MIREARLKEIKLELLNSERLKGYFEDHVPDLEALRHDKPLARQIQPHLRDVPEYLGEYSLATVLNLRCGWQLERYYAHTKTGHKVELMNYLILYKISCFCQRTRLMAVLICANFVALRRF